MLILLPRPRRSISKRPLRKSRPSRALRPRPAALRARRRSSARRSLRELMHISLALADLNHRRFKQLCQGRRTPRDPRVCRGRLSRFRRRQRRRRYDRLRAGPFAHPFGTLRRAAAARCDPALPTRNGHALGACRRSARRSLGHEGRQAIAADLRAEGSKLVVNLASNEYFAVLKGQLAKTSRFIAPDFRVRTAKGLNSKASPRRSPAAPWRAGSATSAWRPPPRLKVSTATGGASTREGSTPERPFSFAAKRGRRPLARRCAGVAFAHPIG